MGYGVLSRLKRLEAFGDLPSDLVYYPFFFPIARMRGYRPLYPPPDPDILNELSAWAIVAFIEQGFQAMCHEI